MLQSLDQVRDLRGKNTVCIRLHRPLYSIVACVQTSALTRVNTLLTGAKTGNDHGTVLQKMLVHAKAVPFFPTFPERAVAA